MLLELISNPNTNPSAQLHRNKSGVLQKTEGDVTSGWFQRPEIQSLRHDDDLCCERLISMINNLFYYTLCSRSVL